MNDVNSWPARIAAVTLNVIGITYYNIMPLLLGGAADSHGVTESQLGFAAAAYTGGMAIVNFGGFLWLRRYNWKHLMLVGNLIAAIALVYPTVNFSYQTWLMCNLLAGLATGLGFGVSIACLGDTREPERNFAMAYAGQTFLSALLIFNLPRIDIGLDIFELGHWIVATLMLAAILLVTILPSAGAKNGRLPISSDAIRSGWPRAALLMALLMLFLNVVAEGAVWAFLERIAVASHLDTKFAATVIAISFFAAGAGSIVAVIIGTRFGSGKPFAAAIFMSITSVTVLWVGESAAAYITGVLLFAAAWNLGSPYRMALAAKADITGRFSTFIPAMQTLGAAVGPALGGMLIVGGSFAYVYLMSTAAWIATVFLFFAARSRLRR
jgi:predicted MFS family arabinose efflux permease